MTSEMKQATVAMAAGALMVAIPTAMAAVGVELSEAGFGLVMILIPLMGGLILGCGIFVAILERLDSGR